MQLLSMLLFTWQMKHSLDILRVLLQSSIAASRVTVFNSLSALPGVDDYFAARDDRD